jgi:hypothetical protein
MNTIKYQVGPPLSATSMARHSSNLVGYTQAKCYYN